MKIAYNLLDPIYQGDRQRSSHCPIAFLTFGRPSGIYWAIHLSISLIACKLVYTYS